MVWSAASRHFGGSGDSRCLEGKPSWLTVPDFEVAYIDQRIKLKPVDPANTQVPVTKEVIVTEQGSGMETANETVVGGSLPDPAPRIGMLKAANTQPLTVARETEFRSQNSVVEKLVREKGERLGLLSHLRLKLLRQR